MHPHRRLRIAAADRKGLAALQRAQPFEAMAVPMRRNYLALLGQDRIGFLGKLERSQKLRLTKPRIRPDWPIGGLAGLPKRRQSTSRLTTRHQDPRPLQRQLAIEVREPSLEQVVDLGAEPAGDDPQHPRRRLAPTQLALVQERAADVPAADLRQAHASLLPQASNALAESFLPGHVGTLQDVKPGFTALGRAPRETALGAAVAPHPPPHRPLRHKPPHARPPP